MQRGAFFKHFGLVKGSVNDDHLQSIALVIHENISVLSVAILCLSAQWAGFKLRGRTTERACSTEYSATTEAEKSKGKHFSTHFQGLANISFWGVTDQGETREQETENKNHDFSFSVRKISFHKLVLPQEAYGTQAVISCFSSF